MSRFCPIRSLGLIAGLGVTIALGNALHAADWSRFRGPNGTGIVDDTVPARWSEQKNLAWQVDLPGPGHSSPIVVGDRVFVTCWSGYGLDQNDPGDPEDLMRHLVCLAEATGEVQWNQTVDAKLPEDRYGGMFAEHGYATHTPVSDGERVYCFFGKSGVHAFDLDGEQVWQRDVGDDLDPRRWGSASSLILADGLLIVTAGPESGSLYGLRTDDGSVAWHQELALSGMWGTPILARVDDERSDLVLAVPGEIWGLNPSSGKLRWFCDGIDDGAMNSSPILADGIAYVIDGRDEAAVAVRVGGRGDVNRSHVVWRASHRNRITTPVCVDGKLYWVADGVANCIDAKSGSRVYRERLPQVRNGRRGRRGGNDYASPVVAGERLYYINRQGTCWVIKLGETFELIATNTFADDGDFSATPAIADKALFVRSTNRLYCIADAPSPETARLD